jgi:enamine deaminase RidA (YjgF/YER057c/UK114 family)
MSAQSLRDTVPPLDEATVERRLAQLGLRLPAPPNPVGAYRRGVVHAGIGSLSGQLPFHEGKILNPGLVGHNVTIAAAQSAARVAALNVLAQLRMLLGSFDRLAGLLRVDGFIASAPGFVEQPVVLDAASSLLADVLGERGAHARNAVGVASLPLNASVDLAVTFATTR